MKKLLIALSMLYLTGCSVIKPGESGVVFNRLTGSMRTESQGSVLVWPGITSVRAYPTSLRTYTMVRRDAEGSDKGDDSIDLPSKENQHINQDISITYNTTPDKAAEVYKSFQGAAIETIETTFIRRSTITVAQNAAGKMSLTELTAEKREDLQAAIQTELAKELLTRGFTLDKVNLGAAHFPGEIETQMRNKMAKQQEAQQAVYELQKQETLAQARVAEAHGIADANKIIQNSLTPVVLEKMKLERWNGVLPQVQAGGSSGILLNVNK